MKGVAMHVLGEEQVIEKQKVTHREDEVGFKN